MKKHLLLIFVAFISSAFARADESNSVTPLLANAGLESGDVAPTNWAHSLNDGGTGEAKPDANGRTGRAWQIIKTNRAGYSMLLSDFIPVRAGETYAARVWTRVPRMSQANVYFMISQYNEESEEMRFPNTFGEVQPIYSTGEVWQPMQTLFQARVGTTRVRLHVLVNAAPIVISLDDFSVLPLDDPKSPPRFEAPIAELLMPLEAAKAHLEKRPRARAERRVVGNRARIFLDGKIVTPTFYVSPFWNPKDAQVKDFKQAGARVYFVPLVMGRGVYADRGPWLGKNKTDFSEIDDLLWRVLRADPDAYIMFYMATDPYLDWAKEHPEAIVTDQDGKRAVVDMHIKDWGREPQKVEKGTAERYGHSYVSSELRNQTREVLSALARYTQSTLAGKAVVGYHVVGGNDGQFFEWADFSAGHLGDYSVASRDAFRDWLKRRYRTQSTLRAAWKQPNATFENVEIPIGARRVKQQFFLDPQTDTDIADYNRFYSEGIVESITTYAETLKREHPNCLISTYYSGPAANVSSHLATGHLLASPFVDLTIAVANYGADRWPGGAGKSHSAWASLNLHGRIGLTEQDLRSWKSGRGTSLENYQVARVETPEEHNAIVRRESGAMISWGAGSWWYDMSGGWFNDPQIMKAVAETISAHARDAQNSEPPRADVAVFADERSLDFLSSSSGTTFRHNALSRQIEVLNRSGVPYHFYVQSDLTNAKLPDYKLYIFLNAHHIAPDEWRAIQTLKRANKVLCFAHAPGVLSPQTVGAKTRADAIFAVTGMRAREIGEGPTGLTPLDAPNTPFAGLDVVSYGAIPAPRFVVDDKTARALAQFDDDKSGAASVAARDFGKWKSVFFGGIGMSEFFVNALAKWSGAWIASPAGDAVFANQHFMTIHALHPGEKTLRLLRPARAIDLATGESIDARQSTLRVLLARGQTRWFRLETLARK